tara:strand:- start:1065 stop:1238 length:174 start_codon:yes stop_codon:yes gene_type:complete
MIYSIQCSMCKAVLESGADQQAAESLNDGIAYLAAIPYILALIAVVILYKKFYSKKT